jgi:two-component system, LytTR family, response regulator
MYNCLLIDDEPHILDILIGYIEKTELLQLKDSTSKGTKAMDLLAVNEYDIVFCDINMPDVNGMDIVKAYKHKTQFIMCTGFPEYAVESFDLAVVDFLVKPIMYPRFMQGVQKAIDVLNAKKKVDTSEADYIFITIASKGKVVKIEKINYADILYIESENNYVFFVLKDKKIISNYRLKELEAKLPSRWFMRIHVSIIVNLHKILKIDGTDIQVEDARNTLPIGSSYKKEVLQKLLKSK